MKNKKNRLRQTNRAFDILSLAPIYLFTIFFVMGPLIYLIVISFLSSDNVGRIISDFSIENYKKIFIGTYLKTFVESFKLAFISTVIIALIGYTFGYFMAKLNKKAQNRMMTVLMLPFGTNSLLRLYGWVIILRSNGILDKILIGAGITNSPLKLMYTYPIIVVGMVYALLPFMIFSVYSNAEKMDWQLVEASRDLGASSIKAFFTITFKLTVPGLLSGVVLTFIPSMGLSFIGVIFGGNKVQLVGNIIELAQKTNPPFAAAIAVVLMILTLITIKLYQKIARADKLENIL